MEDLLQRFKRHWREGNFVHGPQTVLLALSGGLDSSVLARLLLDANISFAAAHCNFGLRGSDSDSDAHFVAAWCQLHGIVLHQAVFDTKAYATGKGLSIQVAARELRYEWFQRLEAEHGYAAILTAHHRNDVAETLLIHLARGSGIAGLHGIPARNGSVIRPLLFASRPELAEYALLHHIQWREDASNAKTDYLRNAIRHEVLAKLEALLPGAAVRIAETAARVAEAEIIFRTALQKKLSRLMERRGTDWYIPVKLLRKQETLHLLAYELLHPFGFSPDQISQALRLLDSGSGHMIASATHRIIRDRDFLIITTIETEQAGLISIEEIPCEVETSAGSFSFAWHEGRDHVHEDELVALLDADNLVFPLMLRTRREGDYFYPLGMGMKKKKLKRFLIDRKVPIHVKDRIRILESDKRIMWIAGLRIDERFAMTPCTTKALQVIYAPTSEQNH